MVHLKTFTILYLKMSCVNNDRKFSDIDCRYYFAKDSIDHDFFELDELEKTVNDMFKDRDSNADQLSMIATCSSDNINCNDDNDCIVMGRTDFFGLKSDEDEYLLKEVQSSADLTNCIAFAENQYDVEKHGDHNMEDEIELTTLQPVPTNSGDGTMDSAEDGSSFPSVTPIPLENSDLTEVTPCTFLSSQSTPDTENEIYFNDYHESSFQQSKMSLLVDALGALKLSQEFDMKNSGLRRLTSKRRNLTFSNDELRRIERENEILLKKITAQSRPRQVQLNFPPKLRKTTASVNRVRKQQEIERQNYILFKKIQAAKTRKYSVPNLHS